jgi:hypothetical protein
MHDVAPRIAIAGKLSQHTKPLGQSVCSLHWNRTPLLGQLAAFGSHDCVAASAEVVWQQALVLVTHAASPHGTNPGSQAAPPSGASQGGPLLSLAASVLVLPPSPLSNVPPPSAPPLPPLLLPLPLLLLLPPPLLLSLSPPLPPPLSLLPPLPLFMLESPLGTTAFEPLQSANASGTAPNSATSPTSHQCLVRIDVLLDSRLQTQLGSRRAPCVPRGFLFLVPTAPAHSGAFARPS